MKYIQFYFTAFASLIFLIFSNTAFSNTNEFLSNTNEFLSNTNEFLSNTNEFLSNTGNTHEYKWVPRYLDSVDENTTTDEVVDFLFSVREMIVNQGYPVPTLREIFYIALAEISLQPGVRLDEKFVEEFYEEIVSRENDLVSFSSFKGGEKVKLHLVKSDKKNRNGQMKISNGFAKGFCKALGGALLCIIPHPVTWGVGGTLIASGLVDMINHSDDPDGVAMEELDRRLLERQKMGTENMSFSPGIRSCRFLKYPISA